MDLQTTTIKFIDNSAKVEDEEEARIQEALAKVGQAILNRAQMYAPVKTGALRADGRVLRGQDSVSVIFGGFSVPYARRRHYENNLHPETLRYLERAGDEVAKQGVNNYL